MKCKRIAYTGKAESILFDTIYNEIANQNEELADEMFSYFNKESFVEDFGDYIQDYNNSEFKSERIDENGEPKLFYNETAKKYYYLNKNNEKVFYPLVDRGLRAFYSYKQISKIKSRLALNYFEKSGLDFNNIDFNEGEYLPNLENFIKQEIVNKINELKAQGGVGLLKARSLEKALKYTDELVENVQNFFKELSIDIIEDEEGGQLIEEEGKDPVFNQHSAERNTKDNISANVKLRLSLLKDETVLDPIWNEPTFLDRDMVYSSLQSILSNEITLPGEDIFENHKLYIARVQDKKPYLKQLLNYLNNITSEEQKSEFSQAFNLIKNNHIVTQFETVKQGDNTVIEHRSISISDTGSKISTVKDEWDINFQNAFLTKENVLKEGSLDRLNKASVVLKKYFIATEALSKQIGEQITEQNIKDFENIVKDNVKFLETLGVELTQEGLNNFLDNYGKDITLKDQIKNLKTLINQTEYVVNGIKTKYQYPTKEYSSFIGLSQTFTKLASSEAFFLNEGSDATIVTASSTGKSKQKWIYSYPSYTATKVKQWKRNPKLLLDLYNSGNYQLGSYYMGILTASINNKGEKLSFNSETEQLEASKKILESLDVAIMNQMSSENNYKETTNLSYKDYLVDYVNKVLKTDDFIRTTSPADKTTELQIKTGIRLFSYNGLNQDKKINIRPRTLDVFFNYFSSEYNRMLEANQEVENAKQSPNNHKLTPHYHYKHGNSNIYDKSGNAFKSQYFEKLSPNATKQTNLEKQITDILYDGNGNFNFQKLERGVNEELDNLFNQYFTTNIRQRIQQTISYLQANDILIRNEEGHLVTNKVDSKTLENNYKNVPVLQRAIAIATDFTINGLISNVEYSKMFTGDVAYYKNMVDYKKRVPASYTDGLQLRITEGNETFNIATINSINRKSPFYDKLVESLGEIGAKPYNNINSADAQAWITPQRWKFLLSSLGKWTKLHDSVYSKMTSEEIIPYTQKELKLAAQPLKGVYFDRDSSGKPTYLKYSQAVLTKSLVKDSDLENVYNKMIENKIDELITFDGVKVGAIEPTTIHDQNGNLLEDFNLNVQTLTNYGWKLQQDLPTKTYKNTDLSSQIQKNIFAGLLHNLSLDNFELDSQLVTGEYVKNEIVKTITGLTNQGLESLKKEFKIGDDYKIGDVSGFYGALISELQKRGGSENVIKALQAEVTIVGIPQSSEKLFNMFASIMNSRLIKIKTNGGSFIQMSNFGLNKIEANNKGVVWNPNALSTTHEPYIYIHPETLRPTVRPGGVLVSGAFIAKDIPDWKKYTDYELFVDFEGKGPIIDKKIQENIIGYRIPNQGLASNDALEIAGILPEDSGDTIVAYTGITTKTGSDFDVDKMYIMFSTYDNVNKQLIYKEGDLGNRLIELYKSVLTHPEVYKSVMKPIDIDFIQNEINALFPETDKVFMNHFDPEVDLQLRYYFLGGKAGVGQEANALVDINREGKISLYNVKDIDWGHKNEEGESVFDFEFSEELSEQDLDYYVSEIIKKDASKERINEFKNELRKVKVGDSLTAILNAFVDIVKDPYISKGNWTTSTTNIGNLLLRIGAHPLYVVNMLANPVIKEYVEYLKSKESLTDENSGDSFEKFKKHLVKISLDSSTPEQSNTLLGNLYLDYYNKLNIDFKKEKLSEDLESGIINKEKHDSEITKLDKSFNVNFNKVKKILKVSDEQMLDIISLMRKQHFEVFSPVEINIFNKSKYDLKYFRDQIKSKNPDSNFRIGLLNSFKTLNEYSKNVRENVLVSKLDTDGMGKDHNNLLSIFNLKQQINTKFENEIKGSIKGFESKFEGTTLGAYFNSLKWVKNVVESNPLLFPSATIETREMFNEISQDIYRSLLVNQDLTKVLSQDYNTYLLEKFFNLTVEQKEDLLTNLPLRFKEFKDNNKDKFFILDELTLNIPKGNIKKPTINLTNRKKSKSYEKIFTDSWRDLFIDNPQLAEDLVKYSFITSGFKMTATQFYTYIPNEYFIQNNINTKVNEIIQENNYEFLDKFYLNNLTNKSFTKNIFKRDISNILSDNLLDINTGFVMEQSGVSKYYVEFKPNIDKNAPQDFVPEPKYYKLIGYDKNQRGIYKKVKPITTTLNNRELSNYGDYVESINDSVKFLHSQVVYDRNMNKVTNEVIEYNEDFDLNALDYDNEPMTVPKATPVVETKQEVKSEVIGKTSIQMQPQNVEKILNGTKTTTIRESIPKGGNIVIGETKIVNFGGKDFYVTNRGHLTIEEAGGLENILKSEGLNSIDDFMYKQSKNWAKGNGKMYIFDIKESFKNKSQQLSLFDMITTYEQIEQEWNNAGYTQQDWNSMTQEERNYIIKNCL